MDSMLIGDWLDYFDLDGDDLDGFDDIEGDDDIGDLLDGLIAGDEVGRSARRRRIKARRARRKAAKAGYKLVRPKDLAAMQAAAAQNKVQALSMAKAMSSGQPQTVGQALATGAERIEYAAFGVQTLGAAVGSQVTLVANIQRAIQPRRIIVSMVDEVTGADVIWSGGIPKILVGVRPVFNSTGDAPADAFSSRAVGVGLLSDAAMTGNQITIDVRRIAAVTNPSVCSAMAIGVSAQ